MPTIFTRIIQGEIPCHKVAESDQFLAFLDIRPLVMGHTLVIPKKEIDYFFDMEDPHLSDLMVFSKKVAAAIRQTVPCKRIGVSVVGLEVPHAHVHLIPLQSIQDMSFQKEPISVSHEELAALAAKISQVYNP
ncbi:MAG: HIT family protein [Saprospirales bacterium]|nr:HIT family protein [Saprospirales bacterium]MBK8493100.1 HIT family protein [Saprospirales bacterium]